MLVTSLSKMEQIVDSRSDLTWDGWDVVRYKKSPSAQFDTNGAFYKGEWHSKFVYPLNEDGWSIPDRIGS